VRQPLPSLTIRNKRLQGEDALMHIIREEVNVKEVRFDETLEEKVALDTNVTSELKQEGRFRDLLRVIQGARKKEGFSPDEHVSLIVSTSDTGWELISTFKKQLMESATIDDIEHGNAKEDEYEFKDEEGSFFFKFKK